MSSKETAQKLEDLAPIPDDKRSIPLWSYILTYSSAVIVLMTFATSYFAIYPLGVLNFTQVVVATALAAVAVGLLFAVNAFPGYKKGIPYAVQARSSFGVKGAKIATILRSLPAFAWLGIATWAGGLALNVVAQTLWGLPDLKAFWFIIFLVINAFLAVRGITMMKWFNTYAAFILLILMTVGMVDVVRTGAYLGYEGFTFQGSWGLPFWSLFAVCIAGLTTGALNASDMSRHLIKSKGSRNNWLGHWIGIGPAWFYMYLLGAFYGMASGNADPVAGLMELAPGLMMGIVLMVFILAAQISSNLLLNLLPPIHMLQDLSRKISWKTGAIASCAICAATCPWILFTTANYFKFMLYYAVFLGPILGITIADYWIIHRQQVDVEASYNTSQGSKYWFKGGFSLAAIIALVVGGIASIWVVEVSWVMGLPVAFVLYIVLKKAGLDRVAG